MDELSDDELRALEVLGRVFPDRFICRQPLCRDDQGDFGGNVLISRDTMNMVLEMGRALPFLAAEIQRRRNEQSA